MCLKKFILICWLLINVGHKIKCSKQTLWLNIVDFTGGNVCKNTFWMSVVVTPVARSCKCEVHTNFSAVLLICSRGPGEIISQTLHGKFFFPLLLIDCYAEYSFLFRSQKNVGPATLTRAWWDPVCRKLKLPLQNRKAWSLWQESGGFF